MSKRLFRRRKPSAEHEGEIDLIPMMDLSLNLTFFFVVLTTLARDEVSQRVHLPIARTRVLVDEEAVPDSININIAQGARLLSWGYQLDLNQPEGIAELTKLVKLEASRLRDIQSDWEKKGFETVVVMRVDRDVDVGIFRKVIDICKRNGFRRFALKAEAVEG